MSAVPETFAFQAEINQLMSLIINAFYSNREVFLRELISNASDALDKARHVALQTKGTAAADTAIHIIANKEARTLTIRDNGIGMSREELISNLGTIARSGTKAFMEALTAQQADTSLIGQFGVGFYSAYLVAEKVSVTSRSSDDEPFHCWESMAGGTFTVQEAQGIDPTITNGTIITLYLREDTIEYLEENKIKELVTKHNAYISHPIYLEVEREREVEVETEGKEAEQEQEQVENVVVEEVTEEPAPVEKKMEKYNEWDQLNNQKPIWLKPADEVTAEEHAAFYKNLSNDWEAPIAYKYVKAEGSLEFRGILYTPRRAPMDMFQTRDSKRRNIKLFVRRVFITDDCEELVPEWLSFIKGVIDSDDLPLNISREMLQQSRVLKVIQKNIVKKALEMLQEMATDKPDDYKVFYETFSKNLKLGAYDDDKHRSKLVELLRFHSSDDADSMSSLLDYTTRAKEGQTKIYYMTGDNLDTMRKSPFIERLVSKGYEVIFMKDAIDEYMSQRLTEYKPSDGETTYTFVNVSKEGNLFEDETEDDMAAKREAFEPLCAYVKEQLKDRVEKVVVSMRLAKAPAAIVTGEYGWTANMERIMKAQALQNSDMHQYMKPKKVFEINPDHVIIKSLLAKLTEDAKDKVLKDLTYMLYDTTLLASGFTMDDTMQFADRIHRLMVAGMTGDDDAPETDASAEADAETTEPAAVLTKMEELD